MRRDLRDEVVTIHILRYTWGRSSLPDKNTNYSLAKLPRPLPHAALAVAQQSDNLWRIGMRQALHLGDAAGGQWAGEDHQTYVRHAQRCRARVCSPRKGTGDDTDRGHAPGFSQNGVVETPRCA